MSFALLALLSARCLESSREEDWYGAICWAGRARRDVYVGGGGSIGPATDVEGCRDERSSPGRSDPEYRGSVAPLLRGSNAERVAVGDSRAGGVRDRGGVAAGDQRSEGRSSRRLVAGGGAAGGSDPRAGLQGAEALVVIAQRGGDLPNGHARCGTGEESPEGGVTSSGILADAGVYGKKSRGKWLKQLPVTGPRPAAEWLARELDELVPLRQEAESWLLKEAKAHPIIKTLSTAPGMGPLRTAQQAARDRRRFGGTAWSSRGRRCA